MLIETRWTSSWRTLTLLVAAAGLLAGPLAPGVAADGPLRSGSDPGPSASSHDTAEVPTVADGYLTQVLADAQAPTVIAFHHGPDALEQAPSPDPPREDLYYANLAGEIVHVDLTWTPLGPAATDRTVLADGFNQPLGLAFDDEGAMYVADSYSHDVAERPVGVVYEVDPSTGERDPVVDGIPAGQHHVNHIRFGPDGDLHLPVGNPNDSGNGTGTGHTDIFPYTGAFLRVDVDELDRDPAVLHWQDEEGEPIADEDVVDHERNRDFAHKVDVVAFGFRNVFDVTWAPSDLPFAGTAYTATNGADNPNSQDTLERIEPGAHHGYPFCVSQGDPGDTVDLAKQHWAGSPHERFDCSTSPPAQALLGYHVCATGLDFPTQPEPGYPDFSFPEERSKSVFVGECGPFQAQSTITESLEHPSRHNTGHKVTEVRLDEEGQAMDVRAFLEGLALPTDVQFGPDGAMYVAEAGEIVRVAPALGADEAPSELLPAPLQAGPEVPVAAVGQSFAPQALVVPTGTTLAWTGGPLPHTVTASPALCTPEGDHCTSEGSFDGFVNGPGQTFTHTFEDPGVYPYFCQLHYQLGMTGMVIVVDPEDPAAVGPSEVVDAFGATSAEGHGLATQPAHDHAHGPSLAR